jgi:deoxyribodipyrimidine photo-lyase
MNFTTDYKEILKLIDAVNPEKYCRTRNYGNGAVTKLSPYISRGVISTRQVYDAVMRKGYKTENIEQFIKELAWRDFFQRTGQHKLDELLNDNGRAQEYCKHKRMPSAVYYANTGVDAVDAGIQELYDTGYMHNHMRMYVASIVTNMAGAHWQLPSQWLYYNLLDADFASNICSWQWVCAVRSGKRYFANQDNINKFFNTKQKGTFLDLEYEAFDKIGEDHGQQWRIPSVLGAGEEFTFDTKLPTNNKALTIDTSLPTCIYNFYNLDPQWMSNDNANRILLLEPGHFKQFAVNEKVLQFAIDLSKNINGIQIFVGEFTTLKAHLSDSKIHYKEHPLFAHYTGTKHQRDWMVPSESAYVSGFFGFWKKVGPHLM